MSSDQPYSLFGSAILLRADKAHCLYMRFLTQLFVEAQFSTAYNENDKTLSPPSHRDVVKIDQLCPLKCVTAPYRFLTQIRWSYGVIIKLLRKTRPGRDIFHPSIANHAALMQLNEFGNQLVSSWRCGYSCFSLCSSMSIR